MNPVLDAMLTTARAPRGAKRETLDLIFKVAGGRLVRDLVFLPPHSAIDRRLRVPIGETEDGDIVINSADGNLVYIGRRDRMVKRRGYRVELGDIEAALYRHPAVREAAVVAVLDGDGVLAEALTGERVGLRLVAQVHQELALAVQLDGTARIVGVDGTERDPPRLRVLIEVLDVQRTIVAQRVSVEDR